MIFCCCCIWQGVRNVIQLLFRGFLKINNFLSNDKFVERFMVLLGARFWKRNKIFGNEKKICGTWSFWQTTFLNKHPKDNNFCLKIALKFSLKITNNFFLLVCMYCSTYWMSKIFLSYGLEVFERKQIF